jgi:hypothetical protein
MQPSIPHRSETYYLLYPDEIHQTVIKLVRTIASTYSTFRYLEHTPDLEKHITRQYEEIRLTKRTIVFAILVPDNPEVVPSGSQKIRLSATVRPQ